MLTEQYETIEHLLKGILVMTSFTLCCVAIITIMIFMREYTKTKKEERKREDEHIKEIIKKELDK